MPKRRKYFHSRRRKIVFPKCDSPASDENLTEGEDEASVADSRVTTDADGDDFVSF